MVVEVQCGVVIQVFSYKIVALINDVSKLVKNLVGERIFNFLLSSLTAVSYLSCISRSLPTHLSLHKLI